MQREVGVRQVSWVSSGSWGVNQEEAGMEAWLRRVGGRPQRPLCAASSLACG